MKKKLIIGLLLASMMSLTGCSRVPIERDTLSLSKDGTATYTIISDFSEYYYDLEELKEMAAEEITQYGTGVQITEAVVEEGVLTFVYSFDTLSDYASFMNTKCFQGTVEKAMKEGYKQDTVLTSVKDGHTIQVKDLGTGSYQMFIWNENVAVRCNGNVLYYSSNLSVSGKRDVVPLAESAGPYYVIYK